MTRSHDGSMEHGAELPPSVGGGPPSGGRVLVRLVAGCVSLAGEQLRAWDDHAAHERVLEAPSSSRSLHLLVGISLRAGHHARTARMRARGVWTRGIARVAPLWERIECTSLGRAIGARARSRAAGMRAALASAEALGRIEEVEGRAMAREALRTVSGRVFERLGDDPEIRSLVAAQSATMTSIAVDELRTVAADADSAVESMLHRWVAGQRDRLRALRAGPPRRA